MKKFTCLAAFLVLPFSAAPSLGQANDREPAIVQRDTLRLELVETGEVSAVRSTTVAAPHIWRIEMQIIEMVPEGTIVDSGTVLVQLDPAALLADLEERQAQLDIRRADLKKMLAQQEATIRAQQREKQMAEYALKLAEVQLEQMKFESASRREDTELELFKAKIALKEAETRLAAQKIIHNSARKKQELLVFQAQGDVNRIQRRIRQLTLRAPIGGLVVYHTDWDGNKPQRGGKTRPGQGLIDLPDLSRMQVKVRVNEVDVKKLQEGQQARISLEAFPDKVFSARLTGKNTIADPMERNSQVRIFEAYFEIAGTDSLLKPGMTARVRIGLDTLPDVLTVPAGCIYEIAGQPVVFAASAPDRPIEIDLLARNDFYAAVDGVPAGTPLTWTPRHRGAHPLGYQQYRSRLRPDETERTHFFTEMEKRNLTFDYEAFRKRPPEPPGGAPGGTEAMLRQLGFPAGDLTIESGKITISGGALQKSAGAKEQVAPKVKVKFRRGSVAKAAAPGSVKRDSSAHTALQVKRKK